MFIRTVYDLPIEFVPPLNSNRTIVVYIPEERPISSVVFTPLVRDVDYADAVFRFQLNSSVDGYLAIDNTTGRPTVLYGR